MTLSILQGTHPIAGYDAYLDAWAADWGAKNAVTVRIERVPPADLAPRAAAEAASASGHDLVGHHAQGFAALYGDRLADLTDLCDEMARRHGGWIPAGEAIGKVKGRWRAYPTYLIAYPILWRRSAWASVGRANGPRTWQDLFEAAAALRTGGHPVGLGYGRSVTAEAIWRSLLWSYGAAEWSADGASVAIDGPETREALRVAKDLFASLDPDVATWNDADPLAALRAGAGAVAGTLATYRDLEAQDSRLAADVAVSQPLTGPRTQLGAFEAEAYAIWTFAKEPDAARRFVAAFAESFPQQTRASAGVGQPFLAAYPDVVRTARAIGYPGPATKAAADARAQYVISDLFNAYGTGKRTLDEALSGAKRRLEDSLARYPA